MTREPSAAESLYARRGTSGDDPLLTEKRRNVCQTCVLPADKVHGRWMKGPGQTQACERCGGLFERGVVVRESSRSATQVRAELAHLKPSDSAKSHPVPHKPAPKPTVVPTLAEALGVTVPKAAPIHPALTEVAKPQAPPMQKESATMPAPTGLSTTLLELLRGGPKTRAELAQLSDIEVGSVRDALRWMKRRGKVSQTGEQYSLAPADATHPAPIMGRFERRDRILAALHKAGTISRDNFRLFFDSGKSASNAHNHYKHGGLIRVDGDGSVTLGPKGLKIVNGVEGPPRRKPVGARTTSRRPPETKREVKATPQANGTPPPPVYSYAAAALVAARMELARQLQVIETALAALGGS